MEPLTNTQARLETLQEGLRPVQAGTSRPMPPGRHCQLPEIMAPRAHNSMHTLPYFTLQLPSFDDSTTINTVI